MRTFIAMALVTTSLASLAHPSTSFAHEGGVQASPEGRVPTSSDLPSDPALRSGTLPNGMRFILRRNVTPPGQVSFRMRIDAGSLVEKEDQRGLAHFMEHMAFNGTTGIPEGEMQPLIQRHGLDSNAYTRSSETVYSLDAPRNTDAAVDAALHIMRQQVSEALLSPAAIDRERGVVEGERRLRDTPQLAAYVAELELVAPPLARRLPIGDPKVLSSAPRERFVEFYNAYYRPSRATIVVVGDLDLDVMEAKVRKSFADWTGRGEAGEDPKVSYEAPKDTQPRILVDAGLSPTVALIWTKPIRLEPDSYAKQRADLLRQLGSMIFDQRLAVMSRAPSPPFVSAQASNQDHSRVSKVMKIEARYNSGGLQKALSAIEAEQRRLVRFGVTKAELDRQLLEYRSGLRRALMGADTQTTPALASGLIDDVSNRAVTMSPKQRLELFESIVREVSVADVNAALKEGFTGDGPILFVKSPEPIPGGRAALSAALQAAKRTKVTPPAKPSVTTWSYDNFGKPGRVVARKELPEVGTTVVTFANGSTLTVKPTKFSEGQILVSASAGLGELGMMSDRLDPTFGARAYMVSGGLGKMTDDDRDRVLTGRAYSIEALVAEDRFSWSGNTNPEDLALQMQVITAYITDPGLRSEPLKREQEKYASDLQGWRSSPLGVWSVDGRRVVTSGDRRVSVPTAAELQSLSMESARPRLKAAIGKGPVDVVIVGDISVDAAVAATASTIGALPDRGPPLTPPANSDRRQLPAAGSLTELHHTGKPDQAMALIGWAAPDSVESRETLRPVQLLAEVLNHKANLQVREKESLAYVAQAGVAASKVYRGGNYIIVLATVTPEKTEAFQSAIKGVVKSLQEEPITQEELDRARLPLLEQLRTRQSTNAYWVSELSRVARKPGAVEDITRFEKDLGSVTPRDIQVLAKKYLSPDQAWRINILPEQKPKAP